MTFAQRRIMAELKSFTMRWKCWSPWKFDVIYRLLSKHDTFQFTRIICQFTQSFQKPCEFWLNPLLLRQLHALCSKYVRKKPPSQESSVKFCQGQDCPCPLKYEDGKSKFCMRSLDSGSCFDRGLPRGFSFTDKDKHVLQKSTVCRKPHGTAFIFCCQGVNGQTRMASASCAGNPAVSPPQHQPPWNFDDEEWSAPVTDY